MLSSLSQLKFSDVVIYDYETKLEISNSGMS